MPDFKEGPKGECSRRKYLFPPTFSLENRPTLADLLGTEKIIFPRGKRPEGKKAQELRANLGQYWVDGGFGFIYRFTSPKRGRRLREEIDWKKNEFRLRLREFGEILGIPYDDIRKTRQALLVGELIEGGMKGIWLFTKEELLQLMVGAHAYPSARRKYLGKKH